MRGVGLETPAKAKALEIAAVPAGRQDFRSWMRPPLETTELDAKRGGDGRNQKHMIFIWYPIRVL